MCNIYLLVYYHWFFIIIRLLGFYVVLRFYHQLWFYFNDNKDNCDKIKLYEIIIQYYISNCKNLDLLRLHTVFVTILLHLV